MSLIDYSQYGQALILDQLITEHTPRIVVDIGAHDGLSGSNSRTLLQRGWRGLLVEPVPQVFANLQKNCANLSHATLVQAACSDRSGRALIYLGKDGPLPQMSSMSGDRAIQGNLIGSSIEVETVSLPDLLLNNNIPVDFGVLLIDTEGMDLTVLSGLERAASSPRIIVTEDFLGTNEEKYRLLSALSYRFVGVWGSDSFWIHASHPADTRSLQLSIRRLPSDWRPVGRLAGPARVMVDDDPLSGHCIVGWAWLEADRDPEPNVVVAMCERGSPRRYLFEAWRTPRFDVAIAFNSDKLLMSGYRAPLDVPAGAYDVDVIQYGNGIVASDPAGPVRIEAGARTRSAV